MFLRRLSKCRKIVIPNFAINEYRARYYFKMNRVRNPFFIEMADEPGILSVYDLNSLATLLRVQPKSLTYIVYKVKDVNRYTVFEIPKKGGGERTIAAPEPRLKTIQRRLAAEFIKVYPARHCVHGFAKGKNTRSNAREHLHKRWIVNIDLKDFFPSIHFGRVVGVLKARPFCFEGRLAREIANLCCCNNTLPQGAPTSPVISNFVCWRLDNELFKYSKLCKCTYTRYADDITFSTNLKSLPPELGTIEGDQIVLSEKLVEIIRSNSFEINGEKVRYAGRNNRQEVTGLIVNSNTTNVRRTYYRQVRAMLHACERYGIESAAKEHFAKYRTDKKPKNAVNAFLEELEGKIGYIKYIKQYRKQDEYFYDSPIYKRLRDRLKDLYPSSRLAVTRLFIAESDRPVILGEGKTDWKYMKKALSFFKERKTFTDLELNFREYEEREAVGYKRLLQFCEHTMVKMPQTVICVFDRDEKEILDKAIIHGKSFKCWGHNIFSIVLPKPNAAFPDKFCIEQYFTKEEITTADETGRRLYLSSEFDKGTGYHNRDHDIKFGKGSRLGDIGYLKKDFVTILDRDVWDKDGKNIALSKSSFADNIYSNKEGFNNFDFSNFKGLFDIIREILES